MNEVLVLVGVLLVALAPNPSNATLATDGKLVGTVTGDDGAAIKSAKVQALDINNPKNSHAAQVKNGFFSLTMPAGYYCLEVSADKYRTKLTKTVNLLPSATESIDIQLQKRTSWIESIPTSTWTAFSLGLTTIGLIFSVSLPPFRARWNRPQLRVNVGTKEPYTNQFDRRLSSHSAPQENGAALSSATNSGAEREIGFYFLRIRVTNKGRRDEAEDVDISVNHIGKMDAGRVHDLEHFIPTNLRWSNTWNVAEAGVDRGNDSDVLVKSRISAKGGQRYCDLGFLVDPEQVGNFCRIASVGQHDKATLPKNGTTVFMLAMEYIRPWSPRSLSPGEYWLELICDAKNTKPTLFWLRLTIPPVSDFTDVSGIKICCERKRPQALLQWKVSREDDTCEK